MKAINLNVKAKDSYKSYLQIILFAGYPLILVYCPLTNNSWCSTDGFVTKLTCLRLKNISERESILKNIRLSKSCLFHCVPWGMWLSNGAFTKFLKTHWESSKSWQMFPKLLAYNHSPPIHCATHSHCFTHGLLKFP